MHVDGGIGSWGLGLTHSGNTSGRDNGNLLGGPGHGTSHVTKNTASQADKNQAPPKPTNITSRFKDQVHDCYDLQVQHCRRFFQAPSLPETLSLPKLLSLRQDTASPRTYLHVDASCSVVDHLMSPSQFKTADPSLHKPRILCLHGGGSNSRIFQISARVLQAKLADHARFVYADAPFFASSGPLTTGAFRHWGPFRAWLPPALGVGPGKGQGVESIDEDPEDVELVVEKIDQSLRTAMEEDDRVGGTGPWVGLLGFSQGAKIAASLILRQQYEHDHGQPASLPAFRFAVLIAGPAPFVSLLPSPSYAIPRQKSITSMVRVPTVHVYGTHDSVLLSQDEWLYYGCSADSRKLFTWDGDHFVPTKTSDVAAVVKMVAELLSCSHAASERMGPWE